jgi:membrane protease subunit HflK
VAQAQGDAQRFRSVLTEYQKAPQVTRERMYVDTMQQVFTNVSKVMIESRQGSNLLYLPLDKLMQATTMGATEPTMNPSIPAPTSPNSSPAAGGADPRSRDTSRTRERDGR